MVAPAILSFKLNPNETSVFFSEFRTEAERRRRIFLDLSPITQLTTETVTLLIAISRSVKGSALVHGNSPSDKTAAGFLEVSGFFNYMNRRGQYHPPPTALRGAIRARRNFRVDSEIAQGLIEHVTRGLTGRPAFLKPSYRTLIEAMANTREHAQVKKRGGSNRSGARELWWATASFDPDVGEGYFACVDTGVGIFESLKLRNLRQRFLRGLGIKSNAELLADILRGKVESTTGLPYRGKGLPAVYKAAKAGGVRRLVIVSNDAFADVDRDVYKTLTPPFHGTIVAWETTRDQIK